MAGRQARQHGWLITADEPGGACTFAPLGTRLLLYMRTAHTLFPCAQGMEQALLFYRDQLQLGRKQSTTVPRTYATRGRAAQRRPGERAKLKPAPA